MEYSIVSCGTVFRGRRAGGEYQRDADMLNACREQTPRKCSNAALDPDRVAPPANLGGILFDRRSNRDTRAAHKGLPTRFILPAPAVDDLERGGAGILRGDRDVQRLAAELRAPR